MLLFNEQWALRLKQIISYARKEILISTFKAEISSNPKARVLNSLFDEIAAASKRGVSVKVLLNWNAEKRRVPRTNLKAQRFLLANGCKIRHLKRNRCIHTKLFIIDQGLMVLGSHNLSLNSVISNYELSAIITTDKLIEEARQGFFELFNDGVEF